VYIKFSVPELCNSCTLNSYNLQFYCILASFIHIEMSDLYLQGNQFKS
jgi:hypothetical protein